MLIMQKKIRLRRKWVGGDVSTLVMVVLEKNHKKEKK